MQINLIIKYNKQERVRTATENLNVGKSQSADYLFGYQLQLPC